MMNGVFKNILNDIESGTFDRISVNNYQSLTIDKILDSIESTKTLSIVKSAEGDFSTVENKNDIKDWGKNNSAFPFHLDGGYYQQVPQYVILYCIQPGIFGGNTFFADAEQVIKKLFDKYDKNLLDSLNIVSISRERKKYRHPLIVDVEGGKQLNWYSSAYIEPDVTLISDDNRRLFTKYTKKLIQDIEKYLEDSLILKHTWKKGDLILFNNQRLLHSREAIDGEERLLYRIWFDKKDFSRTMKLYID